MAGKVDGAQQEPDKSIPDYLELQLRKPITFATVTYDKLVLREPTAAEWMAWDKFPGVEGEIKAVAIVAAVPEQVIQQIGARDLLTGSRYLARFLQ